MLLPGLCASHLSIALSLMSCTSAELFARQTSFANATTSSASLGSSTTSSSAPATTSPAVLSSSKSGNSCANVTGICYECRDVYADHIGLNSWWSSSYDLTVGTRSQSFPSLDYKRPASWSRSFDADGFPATVFTNYIQYNNTIVAANSTTHYVPNATTIFGSYLAGWGPTNVPGIPTTLIDGLVEAQSYGSTVIAPGTIGNAENETMIQSPTAWTFGPGVMTVSWTEYIDGRSASTGFAPAILATSGRAWVATETSVFYSGTVVKAMPSEMRSFAIAVCAKFHEWSLEQD
jgi:hypothetical protein